MDKKRLFSLFEQLSENDVKNYRKDKNSDVLIIDGLNTFIRSFSVNPTLNDNGEHIGGIAGFLKSIGYCIRLLKPTRCIVVFDGVNGSKRRRELFPEYKKNRKNRIRVNRIYEDVVTPDIEDESLKRQLVKIIRYLDCLPITVISIDNIEADDTIAYLCTDVLTKSNVTIMSTDKDFYQLINDRVKVWSPTKKKIYNTQNIHEEYGIHSKNFILYRVFDGDKSDNIDGIKGAGLKTIKKAFPMLTEDKQITTEELIKYSCDNRNVLKIYDNVASNIDIIERNFKLMQLGNVDISGTTKLKIIDIINSKINNLNKFEFTQRMTEDGMHTAINNFNVWLRETFTILDTYAKNK